MWISQEIWRRASPSNKPPSPAPETNAGSETAKDRQGHGISRSARDAVLCPCLAGRDPSPPAVPLGSLKTCRAHNQDRAWGVREQPVGDVVQIRRVGGAGLRLPVGPDRE